MNHKLDYFRSLSESLVQSYEQGCIYFTTDLIKYDFVRAHKLDLQGIKEGEPMPKGGNIETCIKGARPVIGNVERNVYGVRLKVWVWPILKEDEVIGTYGVMIPKLHPVTQAFDHFAEPLANAFPGGAHFGITDFEKVIKKQGSKVFDIDEIQVGSPLIKGSPAEECLMTANTITSNFDTNVFGIPTSGISIPLFDPEDKNLVGTFSLVLPRVIASNLQELATKLSANVQEIASVMEEVAASASEVSANEGQLAERVKEVANISAQINEVLDFIKNVADQTKMLGLNAAIEAARAGEHGRGFGVVAEEIRKLSDQSKETAESIRKLTREIADKIELIREASGGTLKQSEEQAAATEEVTASVMEMAQMAEKLAETAQSL